VSVPIEVHAEGEDVIIRVPANDADSIVWALRMHGRRSTNKDYFQMADAIDEVVEGVFDNGDAIPRPGLVIGLVRR